ncbi:MAG TPA: MFS transporter, partial [Mycobacterium sp.]|nr:MFS transporter [Mycobacterium sp.]
MRSHVRVELWRSVRGLPDFWRLLQLRMASQFGDGLFQAGMAGALLFNPDRAADPMAIARAFAVLFLPYSLLGPFAGALMDRWDRRLVLVGANIGRLILIAGIGTILAVRAGEMPLLIAALVANGLGRFVASGLSASLPHVVPREQVVTMNSVATAAGAVAAFLGANFMLVPRFVVGAGDRGAAVIIFLTAIPVAIALLLSWRFGPRVLGPDDTRRAIHGSAVYAVITGWLHGARTVVSYPTVAATLSGLAAHRMVVGINSLLILLLAHHTKDPAAGGLGIALVFFAASGLGSFLATVLTPPTVRRWGRYAAANGALTAAALIEVTGAGLWLPVMVACSFFLGVTGQMIKLCADSAIQIDVDDALRGHVFAVQDALFWVSFIVSITLAATVIPKDGHAPGFVLF